MKTTSFLEGIRIIEVSVAWAGPVSGNILASLGAEVIKVEPPSRPDTSRGSISPLPGGAMMYPNGEPGERPWNRSGSFSERHRNKLSLTLDLTANKGKEMFKKLVVLSDVVLVNYRAGVMSNLGLDYPVLREANPQLIMLNMPGFGSSGPYKDYSAYGTTIEAVAGGSYLSGYPDKEPLVAGFTWPDPASGTLAAAAIMAGLRHRMRTGDGMLIEMSQMDVAIRALGGALMDYGMNGRVQERMGNRHSNMAPHGCYPCLGDDEWITIAIDDDEGWRAFCHAIGRAELAVDPRFCFLEQRLQNQDSLDEVVANWTRTQDKMDAMHLLQKAGAAAAAVMRPGEHFSDPHFQARGFFEEVYHPEAGTYPYRKPAPFNLSKTSTNTRRHAPLFGEHNSYLLRDLLDLTEEEVEEMKTEKIISDRPLADPPTAF